MDTGLYLDTILMGKVTKKVDFYELSLLVKPKKDLDIAKEIKELKNLTTSLKRSLGKNLDRLSNQQIATKIKSNPRLFAKYQKHASLYSYLSTHTFRGQPWTLGDYIERGKALLAQSQGTNSKTIQNMKLDKNTRPLIEQIRELNELRTERVELLNKWIWHLEPLWKYICRQLRAPRVELSSLHHREIIDSLITSNPPKVNRSELALRDIAYNFLWQGKRLSYHSTLLRQKKDTGSNVHEIHGMTGNPGKVTGTVRIICGADDFKKFKEGEILVAPQTTPNFVTIMMKSKAIITDMGGITCHAAIVSRELHKPCIVGTKIATKALKDGDKVEVDANKGIIKIIKQKIIWN